jgi:hypothetical protein
LSFLSTRRSLLGFTAKGRLFSERFKLISKLSYQRFFNVI